MVVPRVAVCSMVMFMVMPRVVMSIMVVIVVMVVRVTMAGMCCVVMVMVVRVGLSAATSGEECCRTETGKSLEVYMHRKTVYKYSIYGTKIQ